MGLGKITKRDKCIKFQFRGKPPKQREANRIRERDSADKVHFNFGYWSLQLHCEARSKECVKKCTCTSSRYVNLSINLSASLRFKSLFSSPKNWTFWLPLKVATRLEGQSDMCSSHWWPSYKVNSKVIFRFSRLHCLPEKVQSWANWQNWIS